MRLVYIFLFLCLPVVAHSVSADLKNLPVQVGGRVQPFDTFAMDSLHFISGRNFRKKVPFFKEKQATEMVLIWSLFPHIWDDQEFIYIREASLKKALELDVKKLYFSPLKILQNKIFVQERVELHSRVQNDEELDSYFKALQKLENQLALYQALQAGIVPGWVPPPPNSKEQLWLSLDQLKKQAQQSTDKLYTILQKMFSYYMIGLAKAELKKAVAVNEDALNEAANNKEKVNKAEFNEAENNKEKNNKSALNKEKVNETAINKEDQQIAKLKLSSKEKLQNLILQFQQKMQAKNPAYKKYLSKASLEVHYNKLDSFHWAWVLYFLGLMLVGVYAFFKRKLLLVGFLSITSIAFLLHGYGMLLRSLIMERPPVTNMYETVIWVPWVAVIMGFILWRLQKNIFIFICSCVVALFCLLLADSAPSLLDGRLEPLEAVLRSNFWLMTHVLIITMSYSAFFLAFVVGDVLLFFFIKGETKHKEIIQKYVRSIDRCLQVGVVLLALGTVLGGIWADYSWGRFWGWDPKETWALISLLGYLVLLHGRLIGWVKDFGMAVGSVLMFFLIVMAWYGVNYVLGQGLHSYGFGTGGVEYVAGFTLLHLVYVLTACLLR